MNWLFLLVILVLNWFVQKKYPVLWAKLELPCSILISVLSALYLGMLGYGLWDVFTSEVDTGSKVFFALLAGASFAVFGWINYAQWKRWLTGRKK